jgi:hypothetical protein
MEHNQISQLEKGCNGRMALENDKIVFEFESNDAIIPQPNAPHFIEDDPVVDELKNELRETKQRLVVLEEQIQQLFKSREAFFYPMNINPKLNMIHNLNETKIRLLAPIYDIFVGDKMQSEEIFGRGNDLSSNLKMISVHFYNLQTISIDFSYHNTSDITSNCAIIIKFIVEKIKTSHNSIEIVINSHNIVSRVNFVIALCEQLNHEKLSKLKIKNAKISEQTELKNKIDKKIFKKIEIENLITSV